MNLRKAFTLIELLVVIAIIAILAAILFPVFAQAKLMAKAAASTSNQKQLALSEIMYAGDNDDFSVPCTGWGSWSAPFWFGGTPPLTYCEPWSYELLAYTKNMNITNDPTGPLFSATANAGLGYNAAQSINPVYGYDYCVLSGFYQGVGDGGAYQHTIPSAQLAQATATVMFAGKGYFVSETTDGTTGNPNDCWSFAFPGGPLLNGTVDPPYCYGIPADCVDNWGAGSSFSVGDGALAYTTITAGANTGGASARAPQNQEGTISFCDGHAKKLSWAQMSVGTNWNPTLNHASTVVTNANSYMWYINYNFGY
jgi:prepilin-type N-terminal cleavage/methylation domain-containing protein